MNYSETLEFLYQQLPIFQRVGQAAYKADLNNTIALSAWANDPYEHFKSVHIAGTNGKGSVAHMVASVLQEAGYKTGLYTSPHLKDFRERIKINGRMIPEEVVIGFVSRAQGIISEVRPSFFELTMMMAFEHFKNEEVDIAVIETGMGGRLDSTNVITPEVSVITNIGLDHTAFLGTDISSIAREKAGIIKPGMPVVIGRAEQDARRIFEEVSLSRNAPLLFAEQRKLPTQECDLKGIRQRENLRTAMLTLEVLQDKFPKINSVNTAAGLEHVMRNTGLNGRWHTIRKAPKVVLDIAHNVDSIAALKDNIQQETFKHLHVVLGTVNDKDISNILELLPKAATYYYCKADIPRGLAVNELTEMATRAGLVGQPFNSVMEAYRYALTRSDEQDMVLVTGSAFVVAEVL